MAAPYTKPIAIFALMQITIIVVGILAAGVVAKLSGNFCWPTTIFIRNSGFYFLLIPIIWGTVTAYVKNNSSGRIGTILLYSGLVIAIVLAVFMFSATLGKLSTGCGGIE
jgi:Mg2+/citrate symporter